MNELHLEFLEIILEVILYRLQIWTKFELQSRDYDVKRSDIVAISLCVREHLQSFYFKE